MKYLVNSEEMKRYDANTIERFHMPGLVLMERAAAAFVEELKKQNVDLRQVLVVCGTGNNGGDGLAAARMLRLAGYKVDIVLIGNRQKSSEQNMRQQEILAAYGFEIKDSIPETDAYTLVVDALFGVGLSRKIEGIYAEVLAQMNRLSGVKAAVDIPSGISSDSGAVLGTAFRADLTITFAYAKLGLFLWPGSEYTGKIIVEEIGITKESRLGEIPRVAALEDSDLKQLLPARRDHTNKGSYGKLLIVAGSVSMAGAAVLSASAAYAAGCGLVRVAVPEENRAILQCCVPEAVLSVYDAEKPEEARLAADVRWADAVVLGPGIGTDVCADALLAQVLAAVTKEEKNMPLLLDADALNLLARHPQRLETLRPGQVIVTPHLGEMSRLTGKTVADIQKNLPQTAQAFAEQYHLICVLKDARTVTAVCGGQTYLNLSGNHGMATAGSGDVLSGVIGSLLAQGVPAALAAPIGVYLHGKAGDNMAQKTGTCGLTASGIVEGVRYVTREFYPGGTHFFDGQ